MKNDQTDSDTRIVLGRRDESLFFIALLCLGLHSVYLMEPLSSHAFSKNSFLELVFLFPVVYGISHCKHI